MKRWICVICGYIHEGEAPPATCPVCKAGPEAFELLEDGLHLADEHRLGVALAADKALVDGLRDALSVDSLDIARDLALSRSADRDGQPEAASLLERIAREKARHAARLLELLGEGISVHTKENLENRILAASEDCRKKHALAIQAREKGHDAIHDALHEMAKDEARFAKALDGLKGRMYPD